MGNNKNSSYSDFFFYAYERKKKKKTKWKVNDRIYDNKMMNIQQSQQQNRMLLYIGKKEGFAHSILSTRIETNILSSCTSLWSCTANIQQLLQNGGFLKKKRKTSTEKNRNFKDGIYIYLLVNVLMCYDDRSWQPISWISETSEANENWRQTRFQV